MKKILTILFSIFAICGATAAERIVKQVLVVDIPFLLGESERDGIHYDLDSVALANSKRELVMMNNDPSLCIKKILFYSSVSPEGNIEFNKRLSKERIETAEKLVRENLTIGADVPIEYDERYIPWHDYLLPAIEKNEELPYREQLMEIIYRSPDATGPDLRRYRLKYELDGKLWQVVEQHYFEHMRKGGAFITVTRVINDDVAQSAKPLPTRAIALQREDLTLDVKPQAKPAVATKPLPAKPIKIKMEQPKSPKPQSQFDTGIYIKTNAVGWAMTQANIAVEFDFAQRWSALLPIYFNGINYFANPIKFRTFSLRPEIRYYMLKNRGLFVGAHFAVSYFNYAFNGEYRYQDMGGRSPALGGGLTVGYRMPLSKRNPRWNVEFFVGAGIYDVKYDMFKNYKNGPWVGNAHKTYIGLDNVGVSFSYRFDWDKIRGKK